MMPPLDDTIWGFWLLSRFSLRVLLGIRQRKSKQASCTSCYDFYSYLCGSSLCLRAFVFDSPKCQKIRRTIAKLARPRMEEKNLSFSQSWHLDWKHIIRVRDTPSGSKSTEMESEASIEPLRESDASTCSITPEWVRVAALFVVLESNFSSKKVLAGTNRHA